MLLRIIAIIKNLLKSNFLFRGTKEKIYQKNDRNFLSLIEMTVEFDPIKQEPLRSILFYYVLHHWKVIKVTLAYSTNVLGLGLATTQIQVLYFKTFYYYYYYYLVKWSPNTKWEKWWGRAKAPLKLVKPFSGATIQF